MVPTFKSNWPAKAPSQSFFEKALLGEVECLSHEDEPAGGHERFRTGGRGRGWSVAKNGALADDDEDDAAAGWDMGDDVNLEEDAILSTSKALTLPVPAAARPICGRETHPWRLTTLPADPSTLPCTS